MHTHVYFWYFAVFSWFGPVSSELGAYLYGRITFFSQCDSSSFIATVWGRLSLVLRNLTGPPTPSNTFGISWSQTYFINQPKRNTSLSPNNHVERLLIRQQAAIVAYIQLSAYFWPCRACWDCGLHRLNLSGSWPLVSVGAVSERPCT